MATRNGTTKHSKDLTPADLDGDPVTEGYYVWFGMWKGPFPSAELAREAYREWAWEAKHS